MSVRSGQSKLLFVRKNKDDPSKVVPLKVYVEGPFDRVPHKCGELRLLIQSLGGTSLLPRLKDTADITLVTWGYPEAMETAKKNAIIGRVTLDWPWVEACMEQKRLLDEETDWGGFVIDIEEPNTVMEVDPPSVDGAIPSEPTRVDPHPRPIIPLPHPTPLEASSIASKSFPALSPIASRKPISPARLQQALFNRAGTAPPSFVTKELKRLGTTSVISTSGDSQPKSSDTGHSEATYHSQERRRPTPGPSRFGPTAGGSGTEAPTGVDSLRGGNSNVSGVTGMITAGPNLSLPSSTKADQFIVPVTTGASKAASHLSPLSSSSSNGHTKRNNPTRTREVLHKVAEHMRAHPLGNRKDSMSDAGYWENFRTTHPELASYNAQSWIKYARQYDGDIRLINQAKDDQQRPRKRQRLHSPQPSDDDEEEEDDSEQDELEDEYIP